MLYSTKIFSLSGLILLITLETRVEGHNVFGCDNVQFPLDPTL